MITIPADKRGLTFLDDVVAETPGGERLVHCMQCGSCGGSCPNGPDMDHTPRTLFALIEAGQRDRVLKSNTMWRCVSCYSCTSRCPQNIPITDVMYALKRISLREGVANGSDAPALARTFTGLLDKYGRSFEFGLASRYYLFNKPLSMLKMGPLGLSMFTKGRMSLIPTKIRQLGQLQAIIKKAKEMGGEA
ncbi:MAG: 4Fe-4S dicluster domain-containing protein [Pirellulales bacterium]|nr:4Fe-4S dicluster domain-containing protein [Pirellulales bacterium]